MQGAVPTLGEGRGQIELIERALRLFADDELGCDLAAPERLEHAHAEDGAGRASHADNEPPHSVSSATSTPVMPDLWRAPTSSLVEAAKTWMATQLGLAR